MKTPRIYNNLLIVLAVSACHNHVYADEPIVQKNNFEYKGAFRVPKAGLGDTPGQTLEYGGQAIALSAAGDSLFIVCHDKYQQVAEISIPTSKKSNDIAALDEAKVKQQCFNIARDRSTLNQITEDGTEIENGAKIGGLMVWNKSKDSNGNAVEVDPVLIASAYGYYDAKFSAVKSHFSASTDLLSGKSKLPNILEMQGSVPQAGFIGGYMAPIPDNWQSSLGGEAISGMSGLNIMSRTSYGPAAFSFFPAQLNQNVNTPQATALLYYDSAHPTLGDVNSPGGTTYTFGSYQNGVIFPPGTGSIIFIGRQAKGDPCYGPATNREEEKGNRVDRPPPNNTCLGEVMKDLNHTCCYDPMDLTKGVHSYPYTMHAWAYKAEDLAKVKSAADQQRPQPKPWDIKPYTEWDFDEITYPENSATLRRGAAAYNAKTNMLYLVQTSADIPPTYKGYPIIHVYKINIDGAQAQEKPSPVIKNISNF